MKEENRRSFVKKSLATSVSISIAGLIRAHGDEEGGTGGTTSQTTVQTTINTTDIWETTVVLNIWSIDYTWADAFEFLVDGDPTDSVADILEKAIEQKHSTCAGEAGTVLRAPGGLALNPYKYGAVTSAPFLK